MTDKKSDDEIIKGLECCIAFDCRNCPLGSKCNSSPPSLLPFKCALDLINRQKSEIERLKECPKCVYEYDGEITEYCIQGPCSNFKTVEQIKAEAYKEFAEKLENEINRRTTLSRQQDKNVIHIMHNLLKEMVGEGM